MNKVFSRISGWTLFVQGDAREAAAYRNFRWQIL